MPSETRNRPATDDETEERQITCPCCSSVVDEDESIDHDGEPHCRDCVYSCENCGTTTTDEGDLASTSCRNGRTEERCTECRQTCEDCADSFGTDVSGGTDDNGNWVCEECSQAYSTCRGCEERFQNDDLHSMDGELYCESCYESRQERQRTRNTVHNYSYKPAPIMLLAESEKQKRDTMFLGIELECDREDEAEDVHDDVKSSGILGSGSIYCKEDGSLENGFEMVTHPGTFAYWNAFDWSFLDKLRKSGYRSFNTDTCGMHVHVSRDSLGKIASLKLLKFCKQNVDLLTRLSRRKSEQLQRWARLESGTVKQMIRKVSHGPEERYEAVNLMNRRTIEFRLFRGTMDVSAMKRNLALVVCMCRFVTDSGLNYEELTAHKFAEWLRKNAKQYVGNCAKPLTKWVSDTVAQMPMENEKAA